MFNNEKEEAPASSTKDLFLPPIMSTPDSLDVGQKRTVPWGEDDQRDSKTPRTEEKEQGIILIISMRKMDS